MERLGTVIEGNYDLLVSIDADGQFDPRDIPELVEPVLRGEADFATASRFKEPSLTPSMPWIKKWGNLAMSRLISSLAGQRFHDVSCGFRCYNRRAVLHLHLLGRFTYTQEAILNLCFKGLRMVEVPIRVLGERPFGKSRVARSLWRYGFRSARIIVRCYRDYHPLRFFGALCVAAIAPASGLLGFLLLHYVETGALTPHKWAGFVALGLLVAALGMLHLGIVGDMLTRHRHYLEELLARQRGMAGKTSPDA
jgi:glycosyltransferase involved in cell wall biosynthesis